MCSEDRKAISNNTDLKFQDNPAIKTFKHVFWFHLDVICTQCFRFSFCFLYFCFVATCASLSWPHLQLTQWLVQYANDLKDKQY